MTPRAIDGTDLGFPVPLSEDVWSKNVDPVLPLEGVLMTMLAADKGLPEMIPGVERRTQSYMSVHIVGFDLGAYGASAERAMIAGREANAMRQEIQRVYLNPRELLA